MRRALGPIVTTGVALLGAAVVVANPLVTAPHDVSVPSVRLSAGAGAAHGMFDKALVEAIAVDSGDSTSPVGVLKQLFAALAANAGLFGGKAVSEVFPQDPAITPPPPRTAAAASNDPAVSAAPVDMNALANLMQPVLPAPASTAGQIGPELQQALTVVTADTGYVGRQVVAAAIAAAGLTVTEPALITQVVTALAKGDVTGAVNKVIDAAQAALQPTSIILDAVRTVASNHGGVPQSASAASTVTAMPGPRASPARHGRTLTLGAVDTAATAPAVSPTGPPTSVTATRSPRNSSRRLRPQTHPNFAVGEQIRTAFANFGAVVRKLAGLPPKDATTAGSNATN